MTAAQWSWLKALDADTLEALDHALSEAILRKGPECFPPAFLLVAERVRKAQIVRGGGMLRIAAHLLTTEDVALLWGCSERTVRRRIGDGSLPVVRVGGLVRVRREAALRPMADNGGRFVDGRVGGQAELSDDA